MRSTRLRMEAVIPQDPKLGRFTVEQLALEEHAFAHLREIVAIGDSIEVDLKETLHRELVISGGALVSIEPKAAAGEIRMRDLKKVELRATKEIRILEVRDDAGLSQQSAISALEDASALFGMANQAAFRLRGNEVHFTLMRSLEEARSSKRARYSLRNLSEFACFGSGVRPLLTWHEDGERRLALFAEALVSERAKGEAIRVNASGHKVRVAIVPPAETAGIGRVLNNSDHIAKEIWLSTTGGLVASMPLALIDPDSDEVNASHVEMVAQRSVKYEELDAAGKTFNAIDAEGMTFSLTFRARVGDEARRQIESFELALGREYERSVKMGLGTDVVYCSTASINIRGDVATIRLAKEVASWWHSVALVEPMKSLYAQDFGWRVRARTRTRSNPYRN